MKSSLRSSVGASISSSRTAAPRRCPIRPEKICPPRGPPGSRPGPLPPRRFRKRAKHRKDQRLALEIVGIHVTRGAIDLLPGLRDARHPSLFLPGVTEPRGQPTVDQVHEGFEHLRVSPAHSITKG